MITTRSCIRAVVAVGSVDSGEHASGSRVPLCPAALALPRPPLGSPPGSAPACRSAGGSPACGWGRRRAGRRAPSASWHGRAGRGGTRSRTGGPRRGPAGAAAAGALSWRISSGAGRPGTNTSSSCLARLITVVPSSRNSSSSARPADSWPLPPSITISAGSAAKLASCSFSCGEISRCARYWAIRRREHLRHRREVVLHRARAP